MSVSESERCASVSFLASFKISNSFSQLCFLAPVFFGQFYFMVLVSGSSSHVEIIEILEGEENVYRFHGFLGIWLFRWRTFGFLLSLLSLGLLSQRLWRIWFNIFS